MKEKRGLFLLLAVLFTTAYASGDSPGKAAAILLDAKEVTEGATFSAEWGNRENEDVAYIYSQTRSRDGKIVKRRDLRRNMRIVETKLFDGEHWFLIAGNVAARDEYADYDWNLGKRVRPEWIELSEIRMAASSYCGVRCYRITLTPPTDDEGLAKLTGNSLQFIRENRERMLRNVGSPQVFMVGMDDHFIYSYLVLDGNGRVTFSQRYNQVNFNPVFPDGFFTVPSGVQLGKTFSDEAGMHKSMAPKGPPLWDALGIWFDRRLNVILNWSGMVLFVVGASVLALVAGWKIRSRKSNKNHDPASGRK